VLADGRYGEALLRRTVVPGDLRLRAAVYNPRPLPEPPAQP
jgi:hypothetical protein